LGKEVEPRTVKLGTVTKINEIFTVDTLRLVVYKSIYFRTICFVVLILLWFERVVVFQHEVKRRHGSMRYDVTFLTLTLDL
jgi:tellurite resistance protein TehA-like permease